MDHLQVARAARQDQRQGDGRPTAQVADGSDGDAVRRQADDLWRVREPGEGVGLRRRYFRLAAVTASSPCGLTLAFNASSTASSCLLFSFELASASRRSTANTRCISDV